MAETKNGGISEHVGTIVVVFVAIVLISYLLLRAIGAVLIFIASHWIAVTFAIVAVVFLIALVGTKT